ncbi:MAG: hypothetical protein IJ828_09965, partial [Treponema sp.]|nr:hypothetical protein [Treponema sp.]
CCKFWLTNLEKIKSAEPFEYGEAIINHWKIFETNVIAREEEPPLEETLYVFKKVIFSLALDKYTKVYDDPDKKIHTEVCRKMGLCHKKLGNYEEALKFLTEANNTMQGLSYILAEMADCYDLCGEDKLAKVIFREAFFTDPEKIDLALLDSPLIRKLIDKVSAKGYAGRELLEWIPVYGTLYGVFNIRRTLKSQEVGRLKQDIYAKENENKDPVDSALLKPRLLNMYFWLIDYYDLSQEITRIKEVLLKIKLLAPDIYNLYAGEA